MTQKTLLLQKKLKIRIENYLKNIISANNNIYLNDAINYSIMGGGKRIRPMLVYMSSLLFTNNLKLADAPASAIELIHTYSLIHDDLPEIDNDDIRNGRASCHNKFGQANALLTGDILQTIAFSILASDKYLTDNKKVMMIKVLSKYSYDMVNGQSLDLLEGKEISISDLENIYMKKTGALIRCAIFLGAIVFFNDLNAKEIKILDKLAQKLGLAYQIQDDILEYKQNNVDYNKITYPYLIGIDKALIKMEQLYDDAIFYLKKINYKIDDLYNFIYFIKNRKI